MKRFKKVYIEITNICNLSCNFCPKTKRKLQVMEPQAFKHIIEQVKPYTDYIYLHLMGEPTLHPQLETFLEISNQAGLTVNITTNGTLLPKVKDILLASSHLRQVNISLHSFEANSSEVDLKTYVKEVTEFVKEATQKTDIICAIRLWNMDTEELKADNALNEDIISLLEENLDLQVRQLLLEKRGGKLAHHLYLNMAEKFEWPDIDKIDTAKQVFCYGLRDQIGIHVDGTVVPCCLDSEGNIPLGNIFEKTLGEIIEGPRARRIYEGFSNRQAVEELCKRCGYAKRY
ncbi:radical SAM/SPASM domain-containing protein [Niameybacter massiliensis]|uniref:Radical SAM/SPASM domain-containing protein n=1 Tax=Holtiella tumoricola TaxID=3018743 RepID=A0AA42DPR7_9FIRM|nr:MULTISPECIES: radical SAM/SPASM domain-containing protein [Lachnospirales]MDA3732969.1 radical SAM/SPASM domain-containing protein [Holtiella tumoricola]